MFDRLLTGPVVREEGVRRRGRRPKSEMVKAAAAAQAAVAAQAAQASLATAASSAGMNNQTDHWTREYRRRSLVSDQHVIKNQMLGVRIK